MSLGNSSDGKQWRGENWRQRQFPSTMYTHILWVCLKISLEGNFLAFFYFLQENTQKKLFLFSLQSSLIHKKHIFIFWWTKGERENRTEENLLHLIWAKNWRENWIIKISKVQASAEYVGDGENAIGERPQCRNHHIHKIHRDIAGWLLFGQKLIGFSLLEFCDDWISATTNMKGKHRQRRTTNKHKGDFTLNFIGCPSFLDVSHAFFILSFSLPSSLLVDKRQARKPWNSTTSGKLHVFTWACLKLVCMK